MAKITLKGMQLNTSGELPAVGSIAKNFELIKNDLSKATLNDFKGVKLVLNIFPSIDTGTCMNSVREFNKLAANIENTKILCISRDLPFAQGRFCGAEGIANAITLSDFASRSFGKDYNLEILDGPLAHLLARAVIVLNEKHEVIYTELVSELVNEPNYSKAIEALTK